MQLVRRKSPPDRGEGDQEMPNFCKLQTKKQIPQGERKSRSSRGGKTAQTHEVLVGVFPPMVQSLPSGRKRNDSLASERRCA